MLKRYKAIGLMSGTSLDGIDCALIETDGHAHVKPLGFISQPYDDDLRARLRSCFGHQVAEDDIVRDMTLAHAAVVNQSGWDADIIGFHGQTIYHAPQDGITVQIGDGALLAQETGIDVIADMRSNDVAHGGQGAPLAPLYHQALIRSKGIQDAVAVQNIGGVGNVTWMDGDTILAFDTGPGNAQLDDFVMTRTGSRFDKDGALAFAGSPDQAIINNVMSHPYFSQPPPKSLDRDAWPNTIAAVQSLGTEDGAATLSQITVQSIEKAAAFFPRPAKTWYICGGGRHNDYIMHHLAETLGVPVMPADDLGWTSDAIEAECFAYLAVRSHLGLPLSLPSTTGVKTPVTGGVYFKRKQH